MSIHHDWIFLSLTTNDTATLTQNIFKKYMPKFNLKWGEIKSQFDKAAQQPNNTIQINQKKYGMNRIRARLKNTNQSWIASVILVLNLIKLAGVALVCLGFSAGPKQPCNPNRMAVILQ